MALAPKYHHAESRPNTTFGSLLAAAHGKNVALDRQPLLCGAQALLTSSPQNVIARLHAIYQEAKLV
jgi:hypothetical protein